MKYHLSSSGEEIKITNRPHLCALQDGPMQDHKEAQKVARPQLKYAISFAVAKRYDIGYDDFILVSCVLTPSMGEVFLLSG